MSGPDPTPRSALRSRPWLRRHPLLTILAAVIIGVVGVGVGIGVNTLSGNDGRSASTRSAASRPVPTAAVATASPTGTVTEDTHQSLFWPAIEDFDFNGDRFGYALTEAGLHITSDGGAHWTSPPGLPAGPTDPWAVTQITDGTIWALTGGYGMDEPLDVTRVDPDGRVVPLAHLHDHYQSANDGVRPLAAVTFLDDRHGWIQVSPLDADPLQAGSEVYATTDGGRTWERRAAPGDGPRSPGPLRFVSDQVGYTVGGDNFCCLFRTGDAGRTWSAATFPSLPTFTSGRVARLPAPTGIAGQIAAVVPLETSTHVAAGAALFTSSDVGLTWHASSILPPILGKARTLSMAPHRWVVLAYDRARGGSSLGISHDDGATWTTVTGLGISVYAVSLSGSNQIYGVAGGNFDQPHGPRPIPRLYRTLDDGNSWSVVDVRPS